MVDHELPQPPLAVTHEKLVDPLRDGTRSERRLLLVVGVLLFSVVYGNLVPKEIRALDVTLTAANRDALVLIMMGVELYCILTFWLYAKADLAEWQHSWEQQAFNVRQNMWKGVVPTPSLGNVKTSLDDPALREAFELSWNTATKVYSRRKYFDYWFPLAFGWIALFATTARLFASH